jgi:hypothetical protein
VTSATAGASDAKGGLVPPRKFSRTGADTTRRGIYGVYGVACRSVLTLQLTRPGTITSVGLINGYAKIDPLTGDNRYARDRRITRVTWIFPSGTQLTQTLSDRTRTLQTLSVPSPETTEVIFLRIDRTLPPSKHALDYTAISSVDIEGQ